MVNSILPFSVSDPIEIVLGFSRKSLKHSYIFVSCPLCKKTREVRASKMGTRMGHSYCYSCSRLADIGGVEFNDLLVLEYIPEKSKWLCVCKCGATTLVKPTEIIRGTIKSCGCLTNRGKNGVKRMVSATKNNLIGRKFGRWTVIGYVGGEQHKRLCECECGTVAEVSGGALRSGSSKSCGCLNRELSSWRMTGSRNPHYIDGSTEKRNRSDIEYKRWRVAVLKRDQWTCQCCGRKGMVVAHHLDNYKGNPELQKDVDNGLTLCYECHENFHCKYMGHYKIPCTKRDYENWVAQKDQS